MTVSPGQACDQSRFFLAARSRIILTPGQCVTFTLDIITRANERGEQQYTSLARTP
jgi:hypothetical protein